MEPGRTVQRGRSTNLRVRGGASQPAASMPRVSMVGEDSECSYAQQGWSLDLPSRSFAVAAFEVEA